VHESTRVAGPHCAPFDRPDIAAGEALAGLLRAGNAGSNTAADHLNVLGQALESLPPQYRPGPDNRDAPQILIRSDSAGASYGFPAAGRTAAVGFSLGAVINAAAREAAEVLTTNGGWYPAITAEGDIHDGAWVAEATDVVDLSTWPPGTRLILRKERPHLGAQLGFTDSDGHRLTGFLTDTPDGAIPGQLAGLELRHRQHARIEDRIRQAKATGPRNLPFNSFHANTTWLEIIMAATVLVAWAKLIGFTDHPDLACCEIATFRYRVLHVAARITRSARQLRLRIDATWRWAQAIAAAWHRIRAAFT
jgi:Transposase DDE domain group 1